MILLANINQTLHTQDFSCLEKVFGYIYSPHSDLAQHQMRKLYIHISFHNSFCITNINNLRCSLDFQGHQGLIPHLTAFLASSQFPGSSLFWAPNYFSFPKPHLHYRWPLCWDYFLGLILFFIGLGHFCFSFPQSLYLRASSSALDLCVH